MRYICVSPNSINDIHVNRIKNVRIEFMKAARVINPDNECEKLEVIDFNSIYDSFNEKERLNGSWEAMDNFNSITLPSLRKELVSFIQDKEKDVVHVDLGKSIISLYLSYFSVMEGISTNVSFHMPAPDDEKQIFNIGGDNAYSNPRNNLRRYLASVILNKAMTVFIDNPTIVPVLQKLFPRINREIHLDPLFQIEESEEKELKDV